MKTFWVAIFMVLASHLCFSQKQLDVDYQYLKDVIQSIEDFYQIKISYADELIADKIVTFTATRQKSFQELMKELELQTELRYETVNDKYIIIRNFQDTDELTICGYLVDKNRQPINGVAIILNEGTGAVTNDLGYFEVTHVPYAAKVTLSHLSYTPKQMKAESFLQSDCQTIQLEESIEVLQELVVKEYLTVGITKRRTDLHIYPQQLKILPGLTEPDILQSIQQTPGVNSPFETASGIHVRGGSPDQNLVLWNGIKTYNQGHFFGMLSAFNPYVSEEVTFIKNGTTAAYGDRVSSVIAINTDADPAEAFSGGAGTNMIYSDAYVKLPIVKNKMSLQISGRRSFTDLLETFTYDKMAKRVFQNTKITSEASEGLENGTNQFFFNDFNSNFVWKPSDRNKFQINTIYSKNDLDFRSEDPGKNKSFSDLLKTANEGYNFKWTTRTSDLFSISTDVYYAKYLLNYQFKTEANDTIEIASKKNLIRDIGLNLNTSYQFSETQELASGYQFSNNNIKYAFENETPLYTLVLDADDNTINTHVLYLEYRLKDLEGTSFSAGLRYNNYQQLGESYLEPRLYVKQNVTETVSLNVTAEYKSQIASQIKESVVSDLSLENQVWTLASKDKFPVIDSYQLTSGVTFQQNDWLIDAEVYIKRINGITTFTFGFLNPDPFDTTAIKRGNSRITGFDFFIKRQFKNYKTWLGYSYINTRNLFTDLHSGKPFPGNWNIEHTIKWSHFYDVNRFHFSLGWLWHSGKFFTEVTADNSNGGGPVKITYGDLNSSKLDVYHRLDFAALYELQSATSNVRYRVGLSILNLYDKKNTLNKEFRTTPSLDNDLIETKIESLHITPNVVLRVFW